MSASDREVSTSEIVLACLLYAVIVTAVGVAVAMLAGCAAQAPKRADVVVKTDCHPDKIDIPQWATATMTMDADIYEQAKLLLAERKQHQDYEKLLEAANSACQ